MDTAHRNSLQPGHMVHWYKIVRILGQGGFGITYLAMDTNLNQQVAIKEYLPVELAVRDSNNSLYPISDDRSHEYSWGLERFITEAQILAKFDHHNIVRVLTVFEANNTAYILMRYEEGESLQDIIKVKKTLDENTLKDILFPILDGLEKVHSEGFIHRDIKPANIYIRGNGSPVLLDFGAARQSLGEKTKTLTAMVSSGYAPFEQYFSKSDQQGPWTDIYGLGATMYKAITSKLPIDAIDRSNTILQLSEDTLVSAEEIGRGKYSEVFLKAVDHALQFKYQDRPQSIADWRKEFDLQTTGLKKQSVKLLKQEDVLTEKAESQVGVPSRKEKKGAPNILNITVASIVIIALMSLFYIYSNPNVVIEKDKAKEKILTVQEELEIRREELLLLEEKAEQERLKAEEQVRLEEERKRKIAEEKQRKIKEAEEKQKQIDLLLAKADLDIKANRLVSPKDNNAYVKYQQILELSLEHTAANDGIARIGNIFIAESVLAIKVKDFKRADKLLSEANKIIPGAEILKKTQQSLTSAKEKEKIAEEKRIAVENARKIEEEKQQEIKALLIEADKNIRAKRLISPINNNAFEKYKNILDVSPKHAGATAGTENVSKLLAIEIQMLIDDEYFSKADVRLQEVIIFFPDSNNIKEVQQALVVARLEAEKEVERIKEQKKIAAEKARKKEEEKQEKIKTLVAQADADIKAKRLVNPEDENALDKYMEILELSPNYSVAADGIIKIINELIKESKIAIDNRKFSEAEKYLLEAKKIDADSKNLKLAYQSYEQQHSKWQAEQKRAEEIKQLLLSAQKSLESKRLTKPKGNNALEQFKKILEFEPDNAKARIGIRTIFDIYMELAHEANTAENYDKAEVYINKANEIIPNDSSALELIEMLKPKLAEIEKLKKEEAAAKKLVEQERVAKEANEKHLIEEERLVKEAEAKRLEEEKQKVEVAKQEELKRLAEEAAKKARNSKAGEFIKIPGGTYSLYGKSVNVDAFEIGKYEITQMQWRELMGNNPSFKKGCDKCPVENMTWSQVQAFIQKLNSETNVKYRLPTAIEWEYACTSSGDGSQCKGSNYHALVAANTGGEKMSPVDQGKPNDFGLFGMSDNAWEWTCSTFNERYNGSEMVCENANKKSTRAIRGGKKKHVDVNTKSALSSWNNFNLKYPTIGFRLVVGN